MHQLPPASLPSYWTLATRFYLGWAVVGLRCGRLRVTPPLTVCHLAGTCFSCRVPPRQGDDRNKHSSQNPPLLACFIGGTSGMTGKSLLSPLPSPFTQPSSCSCPIVPPLPHSGGSKAQGCELPWGGVCLGKAPALATKWLCWYFAEGNHPIWCKTLNPTSIRWKYAAWQYWRDDFDANDRAGNNRHGVLNVSSGILFVTAMKSQCHWSWWEPWTGTVNTFTNCMVQWHYWRRLCDSGIGYANVIPNGQMN